MLHCKVRLISSPIPYNYHAIKIICEDIILAYLLQYQVKIILEESLRIIEENIYIYLTTIFILKKIFLYTAR